MSSSEAPIAIKFDHVTKTYKLYDNDKSKLVATVNDWFDLSF